MLQTLPADSICCRARVFAGFWPPSLPKPSQGDEAVMSEVTYQED